MAIKTYDWSQIKTEQMSPVLTRQVIYGEKMTVARVCIKAGGVIPEHNHVGEEIALLEQGSARVSVGDDEKLTVAGQLYEIPPDVRHKIVALEDCVLLYMFAPVREDWIRGDDTYLRK